MASANLSPQLRRRSSKNKSFRTLFITTLFGLIVFTFLHLNIKKNHKFWFFHESCKNFTLSNGNEETSISTNEARTIDLDKANMISLPTVVPNQCDAALRNKAFDNIYTRGMWGKKLLPPSKFYGDAQWPPPEYRKESASGPGSHLGHSTVTSLQIIKDTIAKYNVKSMIDIPCGDVNWIFDSFETDSLPFYLGLDIVEPVIQVNQQRFGHHMNKQFKKWDATSCILPKYVNGSSLEEHPFDLVHVRDVIQHMNTDLGIKYFCNIFKSGAKILITTTYPVENNQQGLRLQESGWYKNNLLKEPFSFPETKCTPTHPEEEEDDTCVYDLSLPWVQEFIDSKCK